MKSLLVLVVVFSASAFAQDASKCFTISNNLDRKYCIDKYLETVKDKINAENKAMGTAVAPAVKTDKVSSLNTTIQSRKDQLTLISSEIALFEKQLADVSGLQEAAAPVVAVKKKDKKKDKKRIFGITL